MLRAWRLACAGLDREGEKGGNEADDWRAMDKVALGAGKEASGLLLFAG